MSRPKPQVGQTLYSLNARRRNQGLTPVKVVSVGRKYFTCSEESYINSPHMHTKHEIETWRQKSDYPAQCALYASEQEWKDEEETSEIYGMIRKTFDHWSKKKVPLEDLRAIKQILSKES